MNSDDMVQYLGTENQGKIKYSEEDFSSILQPYCTLNDRVKYFLTERQKNIFLSLHTRTFTWMRETYTSVPYPINI